MEKIRFTIVTSAYNAAKTIHRTYNAVKNMQYENFEWIIVNDGSTDNTDEVVQAFIANGDIKDIKYFKQANGGKHSAFNLAFQHATGDLFISIDADDASEPDTLAFYAEKWLAIPEDERNQYSGVSALAGYPDGRIIGDKYPVDGFVSNNFDLKYKLKLKGEKCGCVRVDLMKSRPFPTMKNSFYPEDYVWLYFAKYYKVVNYNKVNKIYYQEEDSIMHNTKRKFSKNALMVKASYNVWLLKNWGGQLIFVDPKSFLYSAMQIIGCPLLALFK